MFQRWKGESGAGTGVLPGVAAEVLALEGGSSSHIKGLQLHYMAASFIYPLSFVPQATLCIWPSLFSANGTSSQDSEVAAKVQISVQGVVAKPKVVTTEIAGDVDTQAITLPATGGLSRDDWSRSLFLKGKTNW